MRPAKILVAGIGNIFLGDDAFGVETVIALIERNLPKGVVARDFGTRGHDLAFAMGEGYDAVILVDATPRGKPPGTLCLLRLEMPSAGAQSGAALGGHSLEPVSVLHLASSLGTTIRRLYLVGCEPATLECEDGSLGLSPSVRDAVPRAVAMIEELVAALAVENGVPEDEPAFAGDN